MNIDLSQSNINFQEKFIQELSKSGIIFPSILQCSWKVSKLEIIFLEIYVIPIFLWIDCDVTSKMYIFLSH